MRLEDYIIHDFVTAEPYQGTAQFKKVLVQGKPVVVKEDNNFKGILSPSDMLISPHNLVIDSVSPKPFINIDEDVLSVLEMMCSRNFEFLPVLKNGIFDGLISKRKLFFEFLSFDLKGKQSREVEDVRELREELALKDKFLSIIGHDIRNLFNQVLGSLELLDKRLHPIKDDRAHALLHLARRSAEQVNTAFEGMLMWARLGTDQLPFVSETLPLNDYLKKVVNQFQLAGNVKNVTIKNNLNTELDIYADKNMLSCILLNLVYNAIKFTPQGGEISLTAQCTATHIEILVEDNGIGMSEQVQSNLFIGSSPRKGTAEEAGLGMGLIICKDFVEKHNGRISVTSQEGRGTKIVVSFPVQTQNEE